MVPFEDAHICPASSICAREIPVSFSICDHSVCAIFALTFSNMPLFIFSYGLAQENKKWAESLKFNDHTQLPEPYFQWTLINPF